MPKVEDKAAGSSIVIVAATDAASTITSTDGDVAIEYKLSRKRKAEIADAAPTAAFDAQYIAFACGVPTDFERKDYEEYFADITAAVNPAVTADDVTFLDTLSKLTFATESDIHVFFQGVLPDHEAIFGSLYTVFIVEDDKYKSIHDDFKDKVASPIKEFVAAMKRVLQLVAAFKKGSHFGAKSAALGFSAVTTTGKQAALDNYIVSMRRAAGNVITAVSSATTE